MKNWDGGNAGSSFLNPFFTVENWELFFKVSVQDLLDIIGLEIFPLFFSESLSRIMMCN